jgi:hypothetical protein
VNATELLLVSQGLCSMYIRPLEAQLAVVLVQVIQWVRLQFIQTSDT